MELFSYLDPLREAGFAVAFVPRVQDVPVSYDKEEALAHLEPTHRGAVEDLGFTWSDLWRAEQVHGADIAVVPEGGVPELRPGVDGLMTRQPGVLLGIYVADCGLIWVVDRRLRAMALLHSGKKGTEQGILTRAIAQMGREYGSMPEDLMVVLGPCIRPPHYENDFAAEIASQARAAGVGSFSDCGICTGSDLEHYYSYRQEKGLTGRMLGLLGDRKA